MSQSQEDKGQTPSTATPSNQPPSAPLSGPVSEPLQKGSEQKGSEVLTSSSEQAAPPKNGKPKPKPSSQEDSAKQGEVIADKSVQRIMERTGLSREFVILEAMLQGDINRWMKEVVVPRLERIELALKTRPVFREVYLTQEVQTPEGLAVERPAPSTPLSAEEESLKAKGKKRKRAETQRTSSKAKTRTTPKRSDPPVYGGDTFPTSLLAFLKGKD